MGVNTAYNAVTITTAATLILGANPARKGMYFVNNSAQTIYIGPDASITTSNAVPIAAGATVFNSGEREAWRGPIYGIVAATIANARYWEWGQ